MNELSNKQIRMACLFKAVEVLGPNRFRFTAAKEVTEPFLAAAQQFYDFVTADYEARLNIGVDIAGPEPDKTTIQVEPVLHDWTAAFQLGYPFSSQDIRRGMPSPKDKQQIMWENAIILPGLFTANEAKKYCLTGYRLPVGKELEWLITNTAFSFDKETKEGVFKFKDGYKLRLPAAGYRFPRKPAHWQRTHGYYWSSSVSSTEMKVRYMGFHEKGPFMSDGSLTDAISTLYLPLEVKPD